ncbi:MAG: sensor histidine kinase, partial [Psychrobacter sp.]
ALLMSASFLAVGGLSWSISQRLVQLEKVAANHAKEVERLNVINQEVITQMVNGVMVIDKQHIVLANLAAHQLLSLSLVTPTTAQNTFGNTKDAQHKALLSNFEQQLNKQHTQLFSACLSVASGQSRAFTYDVPAVANSSIFGKLRVQIIPLKDDSKLIILEDLRREQASAQQLKLASLGQLTASIAHEIRNPLAAISQASQLLMEDVAEQAEGHSTSKNEVHAAMTGNHELYEMIFSQTKRVNRIIEDILKLSRQQTATQQVLKLAEWIPSFLENYFQGHDIFLRVKTKPIISFDTHQLEQILINLINNGLRYSSYAHPHAYVEIDIYCADNDVIIDILDDGNGVNTENLQLLFDPFFTTDKTGTGLGLYLSQAFCEANQARLLYIPEHEKTCFRLIVPSIKSDNKFQTIEESLS